MLGFVHPIIALEQSKFQGGLLVLNHSGDPVEFRCTVPVRTTRLQQILWGQRLVAHVLGQLILRPLIQSAKTQIAVVLVEREEFLPVRGDLSVPLLLIRRQDHPSDRIQSPNTVTIAHVSPGKEALLLQSAWGFEEDLDVGGRLVREFLKTCHPLEAFQRIEQALHILKPKLEEQVRVTG